jgi:hypothetical protein
MNSIRQSHPTIYISIKSMDDYVVFMKMKDVFVALSAGIKSCANLPHKIPGILASTACWS